MFEDIFNTTLRAGTDCWEGAHVPWDTELNAICRFTIDDAVERILPRWSALGFPW